MVEAGDSVELPILSAASTSRLYTRRLYAIVYVGFRIVFGFFVKDCVRVCVACASRHFMRCSMVDSDDYDMK